MDWSSEKLKKPHFPYLRSSVEQWRCLRDGAEDGDGGEHRDDESVHDDEQRNPWEKLRVTWRWGSSRSEMSVFRRRAPTPEAPPTLCASRRVSRPRPLFGGWLWGKKEREKRFREIKNESSDFWELELGESLGKFDKCFKFPENGFVFDVSKLKISEIDLASHAESFEIHHDRVLENLVFYWILNSESWILKTNFIYTFEFLTFFWSNWHVTWPILEIFGSRVTLGSLHVKKKIIGNRSLWVSKLTKKPGEFEFLKVRAPGALGSKLQVLQEPNF